MADSFFGRGMYLQPDYADGRLGGKSHHVREIGIKSYERAAVLDSEAEHFFVAGAREANFRNRDRVLPLHPEFKGVLWREVFVQKEFH
jgi:hypothetical protein